MRRGGLYQYFLIAFGAVATLLFAVFLYRELFPEYKIYQNAYVALEKFRSGYTGQPPPPFEEGVKQIVLHKEDKGPPEIDRCISCHVALKFEHFSPTKIGYDLNGNIMRNEDGFPVKVPNESYIWKKLDEKIASLGKGSAEAERLRALKTAHVGEHTYNVEKALQMHPLIGRETRPFEYHPMEEYGCVSCHNGNGRALTAQKAHGPVFDDKYEPAFIGPMPQFLEEDEKNDPRFSKVLNHKPGHSLLFQTTPLYVGGLIEAKCMQCHKTSEAALQSAYDFANVAATQKLKKSDAVFKAYENAVDAAAGLVRLKALVDKKGPEKAVETLRQRENNYKLPPEVQERASAQLKYLQKLPPSKAGAALQRQLVEALGSEELAKALEEKLAAVPDAGAPAAVEAFVKERKGEGSLFAKAAAADLERELVQHVKDTEGSLKKTVNDSRTISSMERDIDLLTQHYQRGRELFISQACYACHRIEGLARGGVGPELTQEGLKYPWFVKESIVWPQADLKTSTMPNFRLDHAELEPLMAFLMAQTGQRKAESEVGHKIAVQQWEAGNKLPWEEPIPPAKMHDLDYSMTVFATEGCAACHRLNGYKSNVGFAVEKGKEELPFDVLYKEQQWFNELFPEEIESAQLVAAIEKNQEEIDRRIVDGVREGAILEKIEKSHPEAVESLYSNFRFALRAKNHTGEAKEWKERVRRVLMLFVQQYGLGRQIGPKTSWSGIYRSDEWLMEHFRNPASHVARSIMPVLPFDDTKFYALTYMLDVLGIRNRDAVRRIWQERGFNPQQAYEIHCAQCHGPYMQGNGPVSTWIYPIPKNLRNADFMRNLTRAKVYESIAHGVKGTPMPPWGEVAEDKPTADGIPVLEEREIEQLVDWLFSSLTGGEVIRQPEDVLKWQYEAEDVIEELQREGSELKKKKTKEEPPPELAALSGGERYYADSAPKVYRNDPVAEVFNVVPHPVGETEKQGYYIKKEYYTDENLQSGRAFFELNCAVCHGKDADGTGARAATMEDAKPRMLVNLDWLDTRDDLRLLRSIKFGVPGTSMVAWGDQTSALQRMQLVMYLRTLSEEAKLRSRLFGSLYKAFNQAEIAVENVRIEEYPEITKVEKELESTEKRRKRLDSRVKIGTASPEEAASLYKKELELTRQLQELKKRDREYLDLIRLIKKERRLFQELGLAFISQRESGLDPTEFFELIGKEGGRFVFDGKQLRMTVGSEIEAAAKQLQEEIAARIAGLKKERDAVQGKVYSARRTEELSEHNQRIDSLVKLKSRLVSTVEESKRIREKQREIVNES